MVKRVSFASTKTVVEFQLGSNPTTVPHVGPSIGLCGKAIRISKVPTEDSANRRTKRALYVEPQRRVALLRREGFSMEAITAICWEADQAKIERRDTVIDYVLEKRREAREKLSAQAVTLQQTQKQQASTSLLAAIELL
ncbi:hypothetical protein LEN26_005102 [Aphanomyces euteiches]|nr:hypothetical protein AeMF1_018682 [Aphanomyces euteiches]KAH9111817.1 hypothetical protein LEN26_013386 [Aphanomyces euteiches]KAH9142931.1 hypothetical protein LEN26_005102 [Aphanomyces euteiches]KAH9178985.1 hypothetical protein AeNC1_017362 [Aphanomyces euteiches]